MILIQQQGHMAVGTGGMLHTCGESPGCIACTHLGWTVYVCKC